MLRPALALTIVMATLTRAACGAAGSLLPSPAEFVDAVTQERRSNGFEVRLKITAIGADGQRSAPVKLAVIGQFTAERERLYVRGIAPDALRGRRLAAEIGTDGRIHAIEYADDRAGGLIEASPSSRLFDTGLILWDMFAPWWSWPTHRLGSSERIADRECTIVESESGSLSTPVRTVSTCVSRDAKLSLRTQLFDSQGVLVRTIFVERLVRKTSGAMAAKQFRVIAADHSVTEVEVYGGDENYVVAPDTFAAFQIPSQIGSGDH